MPKTFSRITAQGLLSPPKVSVQNFAHLARQCIGPIKNAFGLKDQLTLKTDKATDNRIICRFTSASATKAEAKYPYDVLPFLRVGSRQYWFAVALEFVFNQGMYDLASVSILVFEGEAYDDRKSALFRAEWDCNQQKLPYIHAQPHWHFYPSRIDKLVEENRADFNHKNEVKPFVPEGATTDSGNERDLKWDQGEKFHFAMAARWADEGKNAHISEMTAHGLRKWLDGCLRYIKSEFESLYA